MPKSASVSAFLVAPVMEQGVTDRAVYLPAGCDWYNFWTNERLQGGQTIEADAPINTLPLFVKAGSIVPLGTEVQSAQQPQMIASVRSTRERTEHSLCSRTTAIHTTTRQAAAR
jgi:alpha-glucosidase (family GH31 glycosyl hydrolase)